MPQHPDDQENQGTNFFKRWSDRKAQASDVAQPQTTPETAEAATAEAEGPAPLAGEEAPPETPSVTEADLENLTYESDYTKFMGEQVPGALRRRALRQLWRSDPILANLDGLCDYDDDYTDAALAVAVLKTAHKVGQGYLTDEEVAANRARGEPEKDLAEKKEATETQETAGSEADGSENLNEMDDSQTIQAADAPESDATIAENTDPPKASESPNAESA